MGEGACVRCAEKKRKPGPLQVRCPPPPFPSHSLRIFTEIGQQGVCGSFAAIFAAPRLNDISSSRLILSPVLFDLNFLQQ